MFWFGRPQAPCSDASRVPLRRLVEIALAQATADRSSFRRRESGIFPKHPPGGFSRLIELQVDGEELISEAAPGMVAQRFDPRCHGIRCSERFREIALQPLFRCRGRVLIRATRERDTRR